MVAKIKVIPARIKVLQKDRIDKDIQRLVYPFNAVLTVVFCSKYSISNDTITPRGGKYCIVRCLGIFFVVTLTGFRMYTLIANIVRAQISKDPILAFLSICLPVLNFAGFLITFIVNIVHGQNNVLLIKIIQSIYNDISLRDINSFILWNKITLVSMIFVDISVYILSGFLLNYLSVINGICELFFSIIDIDFVYTVRLQLLLTKYLEEWIVKVRSMDIAVDEDSYYKKMLDTYKNILRGYDVFKEVSECLILFRTFIAFFRNLCNLELYLGIVEKLGHFYAFTHEVPYLQIEAIMVVIVAMMKLVLLVVIHSQYSDKFNKGVEDTEVTCVLRMKNVNCSKVEKQFCKNVLREIETFSKMTACGLFYVDCGLPLSLLGLLSHYFVVLLQFAFLREHT